MNEKTSTVLTRPFIAVAAMSLNRVIGPADKIPWHLPEDLKWFKQLTSGHVLVMGRKTFESIGRPLPGRTTLVLSRRAASLPGVEVVSSLDAIPFPADGRKLFLCGGAEIYRQGLHLCSDLYLTIVNCESEGDAFFPAFEPDFFEVETVREFPEFTIKHYRNR